MERGQDLLHDVISFSPEISFPAFKGIVNSIPFFIPTPLRFIYLLILGFFFTACDHKPSSTSTDEDLTTVELSPNLEANLREIAEINDTVQLAGTLICTHCYALNHENTGTDHLLPQAGFVSGCAGKCANQGYPIGILQIRKTQSDKVWVIRTSSMIFSDYMGMEAQVTGIVITDRILEPLGITVRLSPDRHQILL